MLTHLSVDGLHGSHRYRVAIQDDRLVIIGENGTGKSTLVNLIYFVLTCQWQRLEHYKFDALHATIAGRALTITPQMLSTYRSWWRSVRVNAPPSFHRLLMHHSESSTTPELFENPDLLREIAAEAGYSLRAVEHILDEMKSADTAPIAELTSIAQHIHSALPGQVLYLPTYRRIEQDLKAIFRDIDMDAQLKKLRDRVGSGRSKGRYVELVEFGMQDVESTVGLRLASLKDAARAGLSNLTGTYLRDVIRGRHLTTEAGTSFSLDPATLESILGRLDEATLPRSDKEDLRRRVERMRERGNVASDDRVVVHFLLKLLELHRAQEEQEHVVRQFVETCNRYLVGKELIFNELSYTLTLQQDAQRTEPTDNGSLLEFRHLSSGEKQIVSLFSHMYLSGHPGFYVLIDEPELSLSVPWQRRFLPDILNTGLCKGLIAVTHSPFVWENELEPSVQSITELSGGARGLR